MIRLSDPNKVNQLKLTDNFSAREFACNHCRTLLIDEELVKKLQELRNIINKPIVITSAYRCPTHNKNIGGSSKSLHMQGKAIDFVLGRTDTKAIDIFNISKNIFNRVGLYQSNNNPNSAYMHVDNDPSKLWWLSYPNRVNGRIQRAYVYFKSLDNFYAAIKDDKQRNWMDMVI